jgi:hypothetical protein
MGWANRLLPFEKVGIIQYGFMRPFYTFYAETLNRQIFGTG